MACNTDNKPVRDDIATITAKLMGVSAGYVRKVVRGDRTNERVFECYMNLREGKNKLIKEVERIVKL